MSNPSPSSSSTNANNAGGGIAKVLVVGNVATGKTSIINRFVRNKFTNDYQTTIGVDFSLKKIKMSNGQHLNVQLWDIAGQDRFQGLSRIFYTHAVAAIIVYDLLSKESFDHIIKWKKDMDSKVFLPSGANIPVLVLGNKLDLLEENNNNNNDNNNNDADGNTPSLAESASSLSNNSNNNPIISDQDITTMIKEGKFFAHYKCSAKTGQGINEACMALITKIASNNLTEMKNNNDNNNNNDTTGKNNNITLRPDQPPIMQADSGCAC